MKYYGEMKNALIKNAKSSTSKLILNYLEQNTEFKEKDKIEDKSDKMVLDLYLKLFNKLEFIQFVKRKNLTVFMIILNNIRKLTEKSKKSKAEEYVSFVEKLKTMWEDAYYSDESNLNKTEYHINADIDNNIDNILNNINVRNPVKLRDKKHTIIVKNEFKNLQSNEKPTNIIKKILNKKKPKK